MKADTGSILLIVTGSIAAYKSLELVRQLRDRGFKVTTVMTRSATEFVAPLSFASLSEQPVYQELFDLKDETEMGHIRLSREHDMVLVAPASADFLAKMAQGRADDLASTLVLASTRPVWVAPAMNPAMWEHPATQRNMAQIASDGVHVLSPANGMAACGEMGVGRMAEPAEIVQAVAGYMGIETEKRAFRLDGRHFIVTAGGTREAVDPVRYIGNRSSGRQGHAIAASLAALGAKVTLITTSSRVAVPAGVKAVSVQSAMEMLAACEAALPADGFVSSAAVADWRVESALPTKIKKATQSTSPTIALVENADILRMMSQHTSQRPTLCVGFAAETEPDSPRLLAEARRKRTAKSCDWMLANDVSGGQIFGREETTLHVIYGDDAAESLPTMPKAKAAGWLAGRIGEFFAKKARQDGAQGKTSAPKPSTKSTPKSNRLKKVA
jgi:phosphopantothenoylcysteine decarboxylase/phosphopantothenate--cysteine ligase